MALATPLCSSVTPPEAQKHQILRPTANFPPSVWGHFFVDFLIDEGKVDEWTKRAELLKEEVKQILTKARGKRQEIYMIDAFKRLGLGYKFVQELEDALQRIYTMETTDSSDHLYAVAVKFRVLREGGFNASADVFNKFKDVRGKFKAKLSTDVKALLSLYEAAFLGVQGEDILDEAIEFSNEHLKSLLPNLDTFLVKQVRRALEIPTHKRLDRMNARYFISIYEESKECPERLIEYAKLDYNILQALHQREVKSVSKGNLNTTYPLKHWFPNQFISTLEKNYRALPPLWSWISPLQLLSLDQATGSPSRSVSPIFLQCLEARYSFFPADHPLRTPTPSTLKSLWCWILLPPLLRAQLLPHSL